MLELQVSPELNEISQTKQHTSVEKGTEWLENLFPDPARSVSCLNKTATVRRSTAVCIYRIGGLRVLARSISQRFLDFRMHAKNAVQ
jgi:hypothetical protein